MRYVPGHHASKSAMCELYADRLIERLTCQRDAEVPNALPTGMDAHLHICTKYCHAANRLGALYAASTRLPAIYVVISVRRTSCAGQSIRCTADRAKRVSLTPHSLDQQQANHCSEPWLCELSWGLGQKQNQKQKLNRK